MQQWEMNETFIFPKPLGNVLANSNVEVVPKWHEEVNEDSVVVKGIYVLKGNIQFDHVAREEDIEEGIYIEHIDIEKDYGYFEYALPFAIDFPNDNIEKVALHIQDVKIEANNGCCVCSWHVHCDFDKNVQAVETAVAAAEPVLQPAAESPVVAEEKVHPVMQSEQEKTTQVQAVPDELDFLEQLADAYNRVKIILKK